MNIKPCYTRGCYNIPDEASEESLKLDVPACGCNKLDVFNWIGDMPDTAITPDVVEVRFKNTRKAFFKNSSKLRLRKGDIVAVEASPGHDIGIVSLVGNLVKEQMKHADYREEEEIKKVYRKAKTADIEKWLDAVDHEGPAMIKARKIASSLKLDMKIGDVEYQGDKTKAIFYYYAEDRVDFRELIKHFAEEFKVRIEMKQIGARQEAGRIGGIGTCGRELCCSTWITNFVSVTTNSARYQEVALNPQKLAGQCGKLKCCLNYELKTYLDAQEGFPDITIPLETKEGTIYHQKTDIFRKLMWYSYQRDSSSEFLLFSVERVKEIQALNKKGQKIDHTTETVEVVKEKVEVLDFKNVVGQESITRFEDKERIKKKKRKKHRNKPSSNENKIPNKE
jgi:cell fate regulator YaaT (PSP1 superfamily)